MKTIKEKIEHLNQIKNCNGICFLKVCDKELCMFSEDDDFCSPEIALKLSKKYLDEVLIYTIL